MKTIREFIEKSTGRNPDNLDNGKYSPFKILEKVRDALYEAKKNGYTVCIIGDYDVDGIMSMIILVLIMITKGIKYVLIVPKRFSEGYGTSEKMFDRIPENCILITIDNGISADFSAIRDKVKNIIVLDHHSLDEGMSMPDADIIVDPSAIEGQCDFRHFCGAGIAFRLAMIMDMPEIVLKKINALAAMATVADCVDMLDDNRIIVREGLIYLNSPETRISGLNYLVRGLGLIDGNIDTKAIGFKLAPCINAAGRMVDDGAKIVISALLSNKVIGVCLMLKLNDERKKLSELVLNSVETDGNDSINVNIIDSVSGSKWSVFGLLGIIAGQIAEKTKKPTIAIAKDDNSGLYKGSGRSVGDFNIYKALSTLKDELYQFGGHPEAAGLQLKEENIEKFKADINDIAKNMVITFSEPECIEVDDVSQGNIEKLRQEIMKYGPYGAKNPEPEFVLKETLIENGKKETFSVYNKDTKSCLIRLNCFDGITAIGFRDTYIDFVKKGFPKQLQIKGKIDGNYYMGKTTPQIAISSID